MNLCALCNVKIDTDEVSTDGVFLHEVCDSLMNNRNVPCRICGGKIEGRGGIVRNVEGEGLKKFHVMCYRCSECNSTMDLSVLHGDKNLMFCRKCKKCDNCRATEYKKCNITVKNDHPTKKFIIICGMCLGIESEEKSIQDIIDEFDLLDGGDNDEDGNNPLY